MPASHLQESYLAELQIKNLSVIVPNPLESRTKLKAPLKRKTLSDSPSRRTSMKRTASEVYDSNIYFFIFQIQVVRIFDKTLQRNLELSPMAHNCQNSKETYQTQQVTLVKFFLRIGAECANIWVPFFSFDTSKFSSVS